MCLNKNLPFLVSKFIFSKLSFFRSCDPHNLCCDYIKNIKFLWWNDFHWNSSSMCCEWSDMLHFAKIIVCFSVASGLTLQSLFMWDDASILCGAESMVCLLWMLLFLFCFLHAHLFYGNYIIVFVSRPLQGISDVKPMTLGNEAGDRIRYYQQQLHSGAKSLWPLSISLTSAIEAM